MGWVGWDGRIITLPHRMVSFKVLVGVFQVLQKVLFVFCILPLSRNTTHFPAPPRTSPHFFSLHRTDSAGYGNPQLPPPTTDGSQPPPLSTSTLNISNWGATGTAFNQPPTTATTTTTTTTTSQQPVQTTAGGPLQLPTFGMQLPPVPLPISGSKTNGILSNRQLQPPFIPGTKEEKEGEKSVKKAKKHQRGITSLRGTSYSSDALEESEYEDGGNGQKRKKKKKKHKTRKRYSDMGGGGFIFKKIQPDEGPSFYPTSPCDVRLIKECGGKVFYPAVFPDIVFCTHRSRFGGCKKVLR